MLPLLAASGGMQIAGGLLGAYGTLEASKADVAAARKNAAFMRQSADYDIFAGKLAQMEVHRQAGEALNQQKVSYAAQGVDLASESVSQVREETFAEAARAANEVELQAAMSAWGKRTQATLDVQAAKARQKAARITAAGQVLGGMAGAASTLARAG